MLHGVGPVPAHIEDVERPYWVREEALDAIVELAKTTPLRLTFDDGNASDIQIVLPKLVKAGLKAAFFVIAGRINQAGYLSEDDILALHHAGMEIGSHGYAHIRWTTLQDGAIAQDVTRSIALLSQILNEPVRSVAIPFGQCDRRVLKVLRTLQVGRVYSSFRGPDSDGGWLVRRDCIMADMSAADIEALVTRRPGIAENTINLLRIWRRAGNAALTAA